MIDTHDRFCGCLLGLAAGDAVGTTVEFEPRGSFYPVTDMTGGGPFGLEAGEWTDDTAMALCLATSLLAAGGFDAEDQMRRYCRWRDEGYLSSNGRCFDIGQTVSQALRTYEETGEPFSGPTDSYTAGNGSIMRLAPVPMFYFPNREQAVHYAGESSRTTHGTEACVEACRLLAAVLTTALDGRSRAEVLSGGNRAGPIRSEAIAAIADGAYRHKSRDEIWGTGYVVRSLEAALWCFSHTSSYEEAVLEAANLGDDADTTAAVCGQVAGAFYGVAGIPAPWRQRLARHGRIVRLAEQLLEAAP